MCFPTITVKIAPGSVLSWLYRVYVANFVTNNHIHFLNWYSPHGYDPCRCSPSDHSPVLIKHRCSLKLRTTKILVSDERFELSTPAPKAGMLPGYTNRSYYLLMRVIRPILIVYLIMALFNWWRPSELNRSRQDPCKRSPQPAAAPLYFYYEFCGTRNGTRTRIAEAEAF